MKRKEKGLRGWDGGGTFLAQFAAWQESVPASPGSWQYPLRTAACMEEPDQQDCVLGTSEVELP